MDNTGIKILYQNQRPFIHNLKTKPTTENINNYKRYKNKNLSKQRKAERDYYREQFEIHQYDLKKSWRVINNIIGKEDKYTPKKTIHILNK